MHYALRVTHIVYKLSKVKSMLRLSNIVAGGVSPTYRDNLSVHTYGLNAHHIPLRYYLGIGDTSKEVNADTDSESDTHDSKSSRKCCRDHGCYVCFNCAYSSCKSTS